MKRFYFFVSYVASTIQGFSFGRAFLNLSEKNFDVNHAEDLLKCQKHPGKDVVIMSYKEVSKDEFESNNDNQS